MADIKKSFNFRNGLQVDDDNFIINANGLVGIGSTIPSERLDVDGNLRITGSIICDTLTTETLNNTGNDGTSSFSLVNVGVTSITNGVISATGSGIVTYYGDARYLQGMPTSQWVDTDVGLGYTSIYAAGNVGVGTTDPRYTFQVGATNSSGVLTEGVGISSSGYIDLTGGINASGIVTASSFSGTLSASDMTTGSIQDGIFDNVTVNINTSGVITASSFNGEISGSNIKSGIISSGVFKDINTTGIITAGIFSGSIDSSNLVGVISSSLFKDINSAGIITAASFSGVVTATDVAGILPGNVFGDINTTGIVTAKKFVGLGSDLTLIKASQVRNLSGSEYLPSTVFNNIAVPSSGSLTVEGTFTGTISTAQGLSGTPTIEVNNITSTGIGSFADVEVKSDTSAEVRVIGDTGAIVSVGQSDLVDENIAQIEYSSKNLKIYNYDVGGMDFSIHQGNFVGINTGNYDWYYGRVQSEPLMRLTYGGKLGLGKTNPDQTLHVVGTSTVTSNSFVGGDLEVVGDLNVDGSITGSFDSTAVLSNSINTQTGVGTFNRIIATGTSPKIGIGTEEPIAELEVVGNGLFSKIGINTTVLGTDLLHAQGSATITGDLNVRSVDATNFSEFNSAGFGTDTRSGPNSDAVISTLGDVYVDGELRVVGTSTEGDYRVIAQDGFTSSTGITTGVKISVENLPYLGGYDSSKPSVILFTVVGVGSTSLALY
jgi:hypothetical protein